MGAPIQFVSGAGLKLAIALFTIGVIVLLDPSYVTAYISINYEIILIYLICALTLLYCIVSIVMYAMINKSGDEDDAPRLTNLALSEIVFSGAGIICWMLVCGIGWTVAERTIIETGKWFGFIAALSGLNIFLFAGIFALFALNILQEKILSPNRKYRYATANGTY